MIKLLGNLVFLGLLYGAMLAADPGARTSENHRILAQRVGLAGIISLGAGTLIITGGIDLSIGAVVALTATVLGMLMVKAGLHPALAIFLVLLLGATIGLFHGLLVTYVRLQAFIVTLCGLFIYRGIARWLARDSTLGLATDFADLKSFFNGDLAGLPVHFLILLVLLGLVGILLHFSVHGRYAFALGSNESAARYCGVRTDVYKVLAYVFCSTLTALYGVLNLFKSNAVQPNTTGSFLELYAIAAAVIGGCSLRGGEGNVLGMFMGTCVITLLPTYVLFMGIPSTLEYAIIGGALLLGAFIDEMLRRYYTARKT
jgi:ribose transport system permease protein